MEKRLEELEAKLKEYEANREEIEERLEMLEQERNTIFINGKPVEYDGKEPLVFEDGKSKVIFENGGIINHGATVNMATNGATVNASGIPREQEIRAYRTALKFAEENIAETKEQIEKLKGQDIGEAAKREKAEQIIRDNPRAFQQIEALGNDLKKNGIVLEADLKGGAYVRRMNDTERTNLGYVPWTEDQNGIKRIDGNKIQWNKNPKINLSVEKDSRGQYIKLESKDKGVTARAYLNGEAKPFKELKNQWEMEGKTFEKNRDRGIGKDRGMEM